MDYRIMERLLNLLASPHMCGEQDLEKDYKMEETWSKEPQAHCTCGDKPQMKVY